MAQQWLPRENAYGHQQIWITGKATELACTSLWLIHLTTTFWLCPSAHLGLNRPVFCCLPRIEERGRGYQATRNHWWAVFWFGPLFWFDMFLFHLALWFMWSLYTSNFNFFKSQHNDKVSVRMIWVTSMCLGRRVEIFLIPWLASIQD